METEEQVRAREARMQFAARLRRARMRHYKSVARAYAALHSKWSSVKRRTYYSHEAGERLPSDQDIERYAQMFEVTPQYLRYGTDAEAFEDGVEEEMSDDTAEEPPVINQLTRSGDLESSHNSDVRFIVVLSAGDIRSLSLKRGDLAQMSGTKIPVPAFVQASARSHAYIIPASDNSMVASDGPSFLPGTCLVIDPARPILPGDLVLADLQGFDEPLFRRYRAARPYARGVRFALEALNPAYEMIAVENPQDCLSVGRLIWTGHQW